MSIYFLFGFIGGVMRAIVGLIKYSQRYKDISFRPFYLTSTIILSGLIGVASSWVVKDLGVIFLESEEVPLSIYLIVGYAGGDLIDNLFKIILRDKEITLEKIIKIFKKND